MNEGQVKNEKTGGIEKYTILGTTVSWKILFKKEKQNQLKITKIDLASSPHPPSPTN